MNNSTSPNKLTNLFSKNHLLIGGIAFLIFGFVLTMVIATSSMRKTNDTRASADSHYTPKRSSENTTKSDAVSSDEEMAFLPANTCPDEFVSGQNGLKGKLGNKTYFLRGEDMSWVDANCKKNNSSSSTNGGTLSSALSSGQCEGKGTVTYTKPIIALTNLGQITPLGRMYDSHVTPTDHQYWQPVNNQAKFDAYPVYAPADATIVGIGRTLPGDSKTTDIKATYTDTEYRIVLEHTCDHYLFFIHLHNLPKKFLDQVKFPEGNSQVNVRLSVKAGDQIGTVGGNSFDVHTADANVTLKGFLVPEHYASEIWKTHTTDPISYYAEPLKGQYYAKVSRSVEPLGGRIDYDEEGKLVGNWFKDGTEGYANGNAERYWDSHLAFAYNEHDGKTIMVSTGNFSGKSAQFVVGSNAPDPTTIDKVTGIIKYSLYDYEYLQNGAAWNVSSVGKNITVKQKGTVKGIVLAQVLDNKSIKVEFITGDSKQTTFSSKAQVYNR